MSNLVWLALYGNELSGSIPTSLGDLEKLRTLYLHYNDLTGQIPSELGKLTALTNLWLNNNKLSGEIPASLGDLTNLERWRLRNNNFTGCVPAGLAAVSDSDLAALGLDACPSPVSVSGRIQGSGRRLLRRSGWPRSGRRCGRSRTSRRESGSCA